MDQEVGALRDQEVKMDEEDPTRWCTTEQFTGIRSFPRAFCDSREPNFPNQL